MVYYGTKYAIINWEKNTRRHQISEKMTECVGLHVHLRKPNH